MRLTTWNVNGIRNPFQYQPWRDKRTFEGMFEVLEADIVVFQETKIQRKDLRDDMVLVPGWDCYWSLPKHKKGYSGVVIYTRNSTCAPIRAEEGITGILCPPNSKTSFRDLPEEQQIGGYPTIEQLSLSEVDAATLDSEGRCVILEFPAFVVLGVYSPANRDESRDHFRLGFLDVLDARIRNLVRLGKRVILTGDINISREELDTAAAEESMRKHGLTGQEFCSTPSRRLFNHLLVDGKVFGERDDGREQSVLWDITRGFHPRRKGMFTCWETKVNARPGNFGARIDYVLCSADMREWLSDSNIQEGLLGSDHCPVYAAFKDNITVDGFEKHILDIMNPPGMFRDGKRIQEWTTKNLLPMSGKLIQEFDRRRNIKDMFSRKPSLLSEKSSLTEIEQELQTTTHVPNFEAPVYSARPSTNGSGSPKPTLENPPKNSTGKSYSPSEPASNTALSPAKSGIGKRVSNTDPIPPPSKRVKSSSTPTNGNGKGQQSLAGFFKPKSIGKDKNLDEGNYDAVRSSGFATTASTSRPDSPHEMPLSSSTTAMSINDITSGALDPVSPLTRITSNSSTTSIDPIATKQSWGSLFSKPISPLCEHSEPCKTMLTKKSGVNCGRSFWMCARPLGPSGQKEKNTQWRCSTFIWASDWNGIEREKKESNA